MHIYRVVKVPHIKTHQSYDLHPITVGKTIIFGYPNLTRLLRSQTNSGFSLLVLAVPSQDQAILGQ